MIEIWKLCLIVTGVVCVALLCGVLYHRHITRKIDATLAAVDDTILNLISHHETHHFAETEDNLLGKFQHEIMQLHDMMLSYEEREAALRRDLSSSISDLVHQINTPITNIKMYSGFIADPDMDPDRRSQFLRNIVSQADKLSWLGEGFAKVSRLETGMITLRPARQELLPVLLRAIDQITPKATGHGNTIRLAGNQNLSARFDAKWTEEVFFNLLDNAVKYSDAGSIITIRLIPYELYSRIDICNFGVKIAKEEYTKIFRRFYRGALVAGKEGVGLGLYLSRKVIRDQKGYITVTSGPDGNTVFSVHLPAR